MTEVCQIPVIEIGGNVGVAGPVGFAYPNDRDRPFAETIVLYGQFGTTAQAEYYSIQYSPHGANTWNPVPPAPVQGFSRLYFDATLPWPNNWIWAPFPAVGGVYESRQHHEATHPGPRGEHPRDARGSVIPTNLPASRRMASSQTEPMTFKSSVTKLQEAAVPI